MFLNIKNFITNNILYIIIFLYLLFTFGIFFLSDYINSANFTDGYILGGDSNRYINGATNLINFEYPKDRELSYIGYIFFIAIFQYLSLSLTFVTLTQIILTILSGLCIYQISKKLSSEFGGLFSISLYLFYFPLQIRNFYILTETIFICVLIFVIYFLVFFKKKYLPLLVFLILFYIIIRPHGILIVPSLILASLTWILINKKYKLFFISVLLFIILLIPFFEFLNLHLEKVNIIKRIAKGGVINGYEHESNFLEFTTPLNTKNDLFSLIGFFIFNFETFCISVYKKFLFFIFRVRPYYSEIHNFYLVFFNFIYLPLSIYGIIKNKYNKNFSIYFQYYLIIFFILGAILSLVDWSGRFSLYILPILFIFSGVGINEIKKIFNRE